MFSLKSSVASAIALVATSFAANATVVNIDSISGTWENTVEINGGTVNGACTDTID